MIAITLDAPLMSFGGPAVDQVGNTYLFPPKSMLTGFMGAALGYERSEAEKLQDLQNGFQYGVREDRAGDVIEDFQTVDLTTPWMTGLWQDGEYRTGDQVRETEKSRETLRRQYVADAVYRVVIDMNTVSEDRLAEALAAPKWPVYVGRKSCGAGPLRPQKIEGESIRSALKSMDLHPAADADGPYRVWIEGGEEHSVHGLRDWSTRIHAGKQWIQEDAIMAPD